jgi:hypothetical protein
MRLTVRSACTAAPVERDAHFAVLGAGLGAHADRSGTNRFDGDAAALKHRDKTHAVGAVNDYFETGMSGFDAARVVRDRAQIGLAPRHLATVAPVPAIVGQNGS